MLRRVVLSAGDLPGWRTTGIADEWVHLWVPRAGRNRADAGSPSRLYSVADHDPDRGTVTLELTLHSTGPAAAWAERARHGDEVMISEPVGRYQRPEDAGWEILVADHAGLPAAIRILAAAPPALPVTALLEVDGVEAQLPLRTRAALDLQWFHRPDLSRPSRLPDAVAEFSRPGNPGHLWMAAEAVAARAVRRQLRLLWGWRSDRFEIAGYWLRRDADYDRRYRGVSGQVADLYAQRSAGGRDPDDVADDLDELLDRHHL